VDQRPTTPSTNASAGSTKGSSKGSPAGAATGLPTGASTAVPRSVELAIRATWALVLVMALLVVLLAVFSDEVIGAWASGHEGAREVFDQGGRAGLERAGFAPPSFLPVAVTMLVVGAMLVWVLAAVLHQGHRWGQLGLFALVLGSAYVSVALGFVLAPPPVFVVVGVVSLLVEGVAAVCLWHPDTRRFLAGPWTAPAAGTAGTTGTTDRSA
jgi:hypothetical protein